jgi:DNA-binding IclR family transcriptional regulator
MPSKKLADRPKKAIKSVLLVSAAVVVVDESESPGHLRLLSLIRQSRSLNASSSARALG